PGGDQGMIQLLLSGLLAVFGTFGPAVPAHAHNVLVGSDPAQGAVLTTGPSTVKFDFNAPVENGPNVITVIGPGNTHWEKTENATAYGNSVSTPVAPLGPAGVYTVAYRIISADGHPVEGEITFSLSQAGTGTPVPQSTGTQASSSGGGGVPIWVWLVIAAVLLGVGLVITLRLSGGHSDDEDAESE
ncbi:MAG TPA: copper resistance CopC family protein, partial [Pseudonocardiaceae bacterium]|nr:copper resistance CopC family protein [Pseudonocardiaceae bacterium]